MDNKTWSRTMEPINKLGYMDGSSDGQTATFQTSFDKGYKLGLEFGLELGFSNASSSLQDKCSMNQLSDPRHINCQICMNGSSSQDSVVNLFNSQKEMNAKYSTTHILKTNT